MFIMGEPQIPHRRIVGRNIVDRDRFAHICESIIPHGRWDYLLNNQDLGQTP